MWLFNQTDYIFLNKYSRTPHNMCYSQTYLNAVNNVTILQISHINLCLPKPCTWTKTIFLFTCYTHTPINFCTCTYWFQCCRFGHRTVFILRNIFYASAHQQGVSEVLCFWVVCLRVRVHPCVHPSMCLKYFSMTSCDPWTEFDQTLVHSSGDRWTD